MSGRGGGGGRGMCRSMGVIVFTGQSCTASCHDPSYSTVVKAPPPSDKLDLQCPIKAITTIKVQLPPPAMYRKTVRWVDGPSASCVVDEGNCLMLRHSMNDVGHTTLRPTAHNPPTVAFGAMREARDAQVCARRSSAV